MPCDKGGGIQNVNRRQQDKLIQDMGFTSIEDVDTAVLLEQMADMRRHIDEQKRMIRMLKKDALCDALTGLLNRRAFEKELQRSLSVSKRYERHSGLLLIDLDNFKAVNDQMGHTTGDTVLQHVARVLNQNTRANDVVARLGGDEFVIILNEITSPTAAQQRAEQMEELIASTPCMSCGTAGTGVNVSASVGWHVIGPDDSFMDILAKADKMMYSRKASA